MKLEKILVCLFVIGFLMRIAGLPSAGLIMVVSALALSLLYLGFSWWLLQEQGLRRERLASSIITGILFFLPPLAILFRLQDWPGAGILLLVSLSYCSILLIVIMLKHRTADDETRKYLNGIMIRAGIFAVLCGALYVIPPDMLPEEHNQNRQEVESVSFRLPSGSENPPHRSLSPER